MRTRAFTPSAALTTSPPAFCTSSAARRWLARMGAAIPPTSPASAARSSPRSSRASIIRPPPPALAHSRKSSVSPQCATSSSPPSVSFTPTSPPTTSASIVRNCCANSSNSPNRCPPAAASREPGCPTAAGLPSLFEVPAGKPLPPPPIPAILKRAPHAWPIKTTKFAEAEMSAKYIFVTGGVVSSLGKGLAAASIGCLLEARGIKINLMKFDPYLNVDPGTMSPFQHGEVFVTDDGAETDLAPRHYDRSPPARLSRDNNLTTGRIYEQIITKERRGDYLGKTVQVIPHVTNEIKNAMRKVAADCDVAIVEIGGTVGDIESLPFLEAIRQMRQDLGRDNTVFVHVTLIPWIAAAQELKTKPTQHSVKEMLSIGIQPDILLCRSDRAVPREMRSKIALFCNVQENAVIAARDVASIYEVPLNFAAEGVDTLALQLLRIEAKAPDLAKWQDIVYRAYNPQDEVSIAIVGKYVEYEDSYKSLKEALVHEIGRAH